MFAAIAALPAGCHRSRAFRVCAIWILVVFTGASAVDVQADSNAAILYVHSDQLGTPAALTNEAGAVVFERTQFPFGGDAALHGNADPGMRLPGQLADEETDLHYNYHRYYDPATGRYVSSDPVGLTGGVNTYTYAAANPVRFSDPTGLVTWTGSFSGGTFLTAGGYLVTLESQCVDGRKAIVDVAVAGPGIGVDAQVSVTSGELEFVEPLGFIQPEVFRGVAAIASASFAIPPTPRQRLGQAIVAGSKDRADGWTCGAVMLGVAASKGCASVRGFAVGASLLLGSATPMDVRWEPCDGCGD